MGAAVRLREDFTAAQLRELAKQSVDAAQTRRRLAGDEVRIGQKNKLTRPLRQAQEGAAWQPAGGARPAHPAADPPNNDPPQSPDNTLVRQSRRNDHADAVTADPDCRCCLLIQIAVRRPPPHRRCSSLCLAKPRAHRATIAYAAGSKTPWRRSTQSAQPWPQAPRL
jgi:hypothetical protein